MIAAYKTKESKPLIESTKDNKMLIRVSETNQNYLSQTLQPKVKTS